MIKQGENSGATIQAISVARRAEGGQRQRVVPAQLDGGGGVGRDAITDSAGWRHAGGGGSFDTVSVCPGSPQLSVCIM